MTTSSTLNLIHEIVKYTYENREALSKDKHSGVHFVNGVYRVHIGSFVPKMLGMFNASEEIGKVVNIVYHNKMEWDKSSGWLTMKA
jgi:hypothetical protein